MDKYRMDSHKLTYHIGRVNDWLHGKLIYPIYMEASPSGTCNHRCIFCGLDFMNYVPRYLDWEVFRDRLSELAGLGLKSIMYAGEGEPFLHKRIAEFIQHGKANGLDNAVTTNGVLLQPDLAEQILPHTEWIKVSINAGTRETYSEIHHTKPQDFNTVIHNLSCAAEIKRQMGYRCALGMQMLLLPENISEVITLANIARDAGIDYLVVKPYSQHPLSKTTRYGDIKYQDIQQLTDKLSRLNTSYFDVIVRANTMAKWENNNRTYSRCLSLPFWSYIDAGGNVWGCSCFLGDNTFLYGNIYNQTFQEIWEGSIRRDSLRRVEEQMDATRCRVNCRMDEVNRYLWDLRHPPAHVNFI